MREDPGARYGRQTLLPEIGMDGQRRLGDASVLVVGAGGLGAPVLQYLAAAGVGRIGVMDGDVVSLSNLNRQILYGAADIGRSKALRAARRLRRFNGGIKVSAIPEMLTEENAGKIVGGYDALALCLDSVPGRKIANRACVKAGIPFVESAVHGFFGSLMTVLPGETACYECVHGASSPPEGEIPILGAMAGWVGCAEAMAVIRLLLGGPGAAKGTLLFFDGMEMTTEIVPVQRDPACVACGRECKVSF